MHTLDGLPIVTLESLAAWHDWLSECHTQPQGLWLKLAKKSSGKASISYDEALEEAICYGWIDAKKQAYDSEYWLQKFSPRAPKSMWSKVNVKKAEALTAAGRMKPAGLVAIEAGKANGAWQAAYDSPSTITMPEDFQKALDRNPKAKAFYATLNKANVYGFCWRIQTAKKPETRQARIEKFIDMLNRGERLQ